MIDIDNCKKCFKITKVYKEIGLCDDCYEKEVKEVKDYLYDHPHATLNNVVRDLSKKVILINFMINDYRIQEDPVIKDFKTRLKNFNINSVSNVMNDDSIDDNAKMRFIKTNRRR